MKDGRRERGARTQEALVAAAGDLFVEQGYTRTTLTEVATRAGVSARTVYVRFDTKADLLKRVLDVAVVGDLEERPLRDREWIERAMTAPTLPERIDAFATGSAALHQRLAPLMAIAMQAEATEPVIAEASRAGREGTQAMVREFWTRAQRDALVPAGIELDWVVETAFVLGSADTAVLRLRTVGLDEYATWLRRAFLLLATAPT
ncbi:MAG: helix-turn-helix domain-containing protein [Ornithinimicrobium sp.]